MERWIKSQITGFLASRSLTPVIGPEDQDTTDPAFYEKLGGVLRGSLGDLLKSCVLGAHTESSCQHDLLLNAAVHCGLPFPAERPHDMRKAFFDNLREVLQMCTIDGPVVAVLPSFAHAESGWTSDLFNRDPFRLLYSPLAPEGILFMRSQRRFESLLHEAWSANEHPALSVPFWLLHQLFEQTVIAQAGERIRSEPFSADTLREIDEAIAALNHPNLDKEKIIASAARRLAGERFLREANIAELFPEGFRHPCGAWFEIYIKRLAAERGKLPSPGTPFEHAMEAVSNALVALFGTRAANSVKAAKCDGSGYVLLSNDGEHCFNVARRRVLAELPEFGCKVAISTPITSITRM